MKTEAKQYLSDTAEIEQAAIFSEQARQAYEQMADLDDDMEWRTRTTPTYLEQLVAEAR